MALEEDPLYRLELALVATGAVPSGWSATDLAPLWRVSPAASSMLYFLWSVDDERHAQAHDACGAARQRALDVHADLDAFWATQSDAIRRVAPTPPALDVLVAAHAGLAVDPLTPIARLTRGGGPTSWSPVAGLAADALSDDAWQRSKDPEAMLSILAFADVERSACRRLLEACAYSESLGHLLHTWRQVEEGEASIYDGPSYDSLWFMSGVLRVELDSLPPIRRGPLMQKLAIDIRTVFPHPPLLAELAATPRS